MTNSNQNRPEQGFDANYYLETYPYISVKHDELFLHYQTFGWKEGKNPCALFDTKFYVENAGEAFAESGLDPLSHYFSDGWLQDILFHPIIQNTEFLRNFSKNGDAPLGEILNESWKTEIGNPGLLFDVGYYLDQTEIPEGIDPLSHYLRTGWKDGINPHPLFSIEFYLDKNREVASKGIEPLGHYLATVEKNGQRTHPMIDMGYYQGQVNKRLSASQILPHYLTIGHSKGLSLHPLFDAQQYETRFAPLIPIGEPPMCHFFREGWKRDLTPHGHFDPVYYKLTYGLKDEENPILHFIQVGAGRLYNPSAEFDSTAYLIRYLDVRYCGVDPFTHFVRSGHQEGRFGTPVGDPNYIDEVRRNPFPQDHLWRPSALDTDLARKSEWFDEDYYLEMNPDVKEAGSDPLRHYLIHGTNERRSPSLGFDTAYYLKTHEPYAESYLPALLFHEKYGRELGLATQSKDSFTIESYNDEEELLPVKGVKWALHAHVYYPDIAAQIRDYIEQCKHSIDLFVSVHLEENLDFVRATLGQATNINRLDVRVTPNRGRDLAPLFIGFRDIWSEYDVVAHIHTKRSPHTDFGERWRTYLFEMMLGHPNLVSHILNHFDKDSSVGMIYPDNWLDIKPFVNIGTNAKITKGLLNRLGFSDSASESAGGDFAAGSMCWMRSTSFQPLLNLNLTYEDFAEEGSQLDGTLAHAIERCLADLPRVQGQKVLKYYAPMPNPEALRAVGGRWSPEGDPWSGKWFRMTKIARHRPVPLSPLSKFVNQDSLNIHWVIPDFQRGAGGHMTIFRHIHFYEKFGHRQTVWIQNPHVQKSPWEAKQNINKWFQTIGDSVNVRFLPDEVEGISGDAVIATDCWTAYPVGQMTRFKERFYFIQDYEPAFHPVGDDYMVAMDTYDFGFAALTAGNWLFKKAQEHNMWAHSWPLCVDREYYFPRLCSREDERKQEAFRGWRSPVAKRRSRMLRRVQHEWRDKSDHRARKAHLPKGWLRQIAELPPREEAGPIKIAFYARAYTTRRLVGIGFAAFHDLHLRGIDFELIFFGQDDVVADGDYKNENRGILTPAQLGDLYRECDIGVVFSATNYSLIPLEMMACGLPIVEVDTESTRAAFPRGTAQFATPNPPSIADAIELLISSEKTREQQKKIAFEFVDTLYWEESARDSVKGITTRLDDVGMEGMKVNDWISTHDSPYRASIVVPTFNGGELFKTCLEGLVGQKTNWDYEVLVIDSGSSDQTVEIAKEFANQGVRLHQIPNDEFQHGATRNLGASMTYGEFIVFTTQDAIPANDKWLANLIAGFDQGERVAGVTGKHVPHDDASPFVKRDFQRMFRYFDALPHVFSWGMQLPSHIRRGAQSWQQLLHFYSDNNSAMRRSVWEKLPYPEIEWGEDQVWAWEILKLGFEKVYVSDAIIKHSHNETYKSRLKVAEAEARMFFENFGYLFLRNEPEAEAQYRAMCAADESVSEQKKVTSEVFETQKQLHRATVDGRLKILESK